MKIKLVYFENITWDIDAVDSTTYFDRVKSYEYKVFMKLTTSLSKGERSSLFLTIVYDKGKQLYHIAT